MSSPTPISNFVWHDCLTPDIDRAINFFSTLTSWDVLEQSSPNVGRYPIIQSKSGAIAGILEMPEFLQTSGVPPYWTGYVHADLTVAADSIPKLGGQIFTAPVKSAMGTSFVFTDPGGAVLAAYEPSDAFSLPSTTGESEILRQRLYSADSKKSIDFYKSLFDWQEKDGEQESVILKNRSGITIGDLAPKASWIESDTWVFFIGVPDVLTTVAAIEGNEGLILERTTIENHQAIIAKDSQGGVIGFVEQ